METLKIGLLAIALLALAFAGMAIRILAKKGGRFPNTHVSGNKYLRSRGISCAQSFDKAEQKKAAKESALKNLMVDKKRIPK